MLDQSFSHENFRIILDVENRRGKYLEDKDFFDGGDVFREPRVITEKLIELNRLIKIEKKKLPPIEKRTDDNCTEWNRLLEEKENLKQEREDRRLEILQQINLKINERNFKVCIQKGIEKYDKQLYVTENTPENFFILKQLQRNIYKTFSVKQANRKTIISQLKLSLEDNFPKVIIKTDFKSFYESIPHKQLYTKIEENSLLSYPSKTIIKDILNQYWKILVADGVKLDTDERVGVPRGLGISAYLSELYLTDFDKIISSLSNVTFYARYVDDIVIIITPENRAESKTSQNYKENIKRIISRYKLEMNNDKTKIFDFRKSNTERNASKEYEITYLGYKFVISYKKEMGTQNVVKRKNQICMSSNKLERNKKKIIEAFKEFERRIVKYAGAEKQTNKLLIQRVKILTHNFQLFRRKSNVLVGVYFSNEFLTCKTDLEILDKVLKNEIGRLSHLLSANTKETLESYSFVKGHEDRKIVKFNFNKNAKRGIFHIERALNIWDDL